MFHSLRSRLWLSYAALIVIALAVVAAVLMLFLLRNPLLYRKTFERLAAAETVLASQAEPGAQLDPVAHAFDVRALLYSPEGQLLADSGPKQAVMQLPAGSAKLRPTGITRDLSGRYWLYSVKHLSSGEWLLTAAPCPRVVPLLAVLTDELSAPFVEGGVIALLLSLVAAYLVARWMAGPLEGIAAAARTTPAEKIPPVPVRGPQEVQELARAFNDMVARVHKSRIAQRDFVANVSHELKTPLTSIQGFAQALMDGTVQGADKQQQAAQVIYDEAGRMHRMALDLLDLARLDAGTAELKRAPVDMAALLRGICGKFEPLSMNAGVALHLALAPGLPALQGDGDRLAQVFGNLVDNAIKFTPQGGSVTIRAMQDRNELQVSVQDTGQGIPREALAHIFDRFYQADAARSGGRGHGSGLGLAIAHDVVAAHGGRISVRSAEGRGTGFVVHLPVRNPSS